MKKNNGKSTKGATMTEEVVRSIKLDDILPPKWNSRVAKTSVDGVKAEGEALAALGTSLRVNGQQTPIEVEGPDENQKYTLIFGDRRRRAAISIGWHEIKAIVREPGDAETARDRNIIENWQREDLTTFERARSVSELLRGGRRLRDVSQTTGAAEGYVSKLNTAYTGLPKPVLDDWAAGHPAAHTGVLYDIASSDSTPEDKCRNWDAHVKAYGKKLASETKCQDKYPRHLFSDKGVCSRCGAKKEESTTETITVKQSAIKQLMRVLKSSKTPASIGPSKVDKQWLYALAQHLTGNRARPPEGIMENDPMVQEEQAKVAAAAKAAAAKPTGKRA